MFQLTLSSAVLSFFLSSSTIDIVRIFSFYQTECEITSNWSSNLHLLDMFIGYSDYFFLWVASYSVFAQFLLGWVKICERSEVLPYLQAKNLACQFTDAGGRHEIPGLETKDFITYRITSSMSISIFTSILLGPSPTGVQMDLDGCLHTSWVEIDKPWA